MSIGSGQGSAIRGPGKSVAVLLQILHLLSAKCASQMGTGSDVAHDYGGGEDCQEQHHNGRWFRRVKRQGIDSRGLI